MRRFNWQDIFTMIKHRNDILFLDHGTLLTRGDPFGPAAVFAHLSPVHGNFIGVSSLDKDEPVLIGQIHHDQGGKSAHLVYVLPADNCTTAALPSLMDGMAKLVGGWGANRLLAEVEDHSLAFTAMRRAGFSVYARQRIWQLPVHEGNGRHAAPSGCSWQVALPEDEFALKRLYHELLPPLVQYAEPMEKIRPQALIYRSEGRVLGTVTGICGTHGILLYPLFHPDVENAVELVQSLPYYFMPLLGRPVYLGVRSYQAWLEGSLQEIHAKSGPKHSLMVRHLAQVQRVVLSDRMHTFETSGAEKTATAIQFEMKDH